MKRLLFSTLMVMAPVSGIAWPLAEAKEDLEILGRLLP
jgi:hypothetical protein